MHPAARGETTDTSHDILFYAISALDFSAADAKFKMLHECVTNIMYAGGTPMTAIDRREVLRVLLGGAVVATVGLAMLPDAAESRPTYD